MGGPYLTRRASEGRPGSREDSSIVRESVVTANVTEAAYNQLQVGSPAQFIPSDGSPQLEGRVTSLTGVAEAPANLAISPASLAKEPYRATVSFPKIESTQGCAVGRTGRVVSQQGRREGVLISELPAYLSLSLVVFGACLLMIAVARPNSNAARQIFAAAVFLLMLRYFFWRATSTLPAIDWTLDFVHRHHMLCTESGALLTAAVSLVFLSKTHHRTDDVDANKAWLSANRPPLVDVFV